MDRLSELLERTASLHHHLCPRQVLGVRLGRLAGRRLGLDLPQQDKRLFVFIETDGCAADGVAVATGCSVGRRTMRVLDFGKVAATFVDTTSGEALRIHPHPDARGRAIETCRDVPDRWHAQLQAYQILPDEGLLVTDSVQLLVDLDAIISHPGLRAVCQDCEEEVINGREVRADGRTVCRACAGEAYYRTASSASGPGDG